MLADYAIYTGICQSRQHHKGGSSMTSMTGFEFKQFCGKYKVADSKNLFSRWKQGLTDKEIMPLNVLSNFNLKKRVKATFLNHLGVIPMIYCLAVLCYTCFIKVIDKYCSYCMCNGRINDEMSYKRIRNDTNSVELSGRLLKTSTITIVSRAAAMKATTGIIYDNNNSDIDNGYNNHKTRLTLSYDYSENQKDFLSREWMNVLLYMTIFWIFWFLIFFINWLFIYVRNDVVANQFEPLYYSFLLFTSITKFILKKIARQVDRKRIELIPRNYSCNYNLFSMEWIAEMLMSGLYWYYYRLLVIVNFQSIPIVQIIMLHLFHFASEFVQTSVRTSECYHSSTEVLWNHWEKYDSQCFGNVARFRHAIKDDSNYNEWITRHCVDILIRFHCSVASAMYWVLTLAVMGPDGFKQDTSDWFGNFYYALIFSITTLVVEMLYFSLTLIFQADNNPDYTIVNAYYNVWKCHKKKLLASFVCCWLLSIPDG